MRAIPKETLINALKGHENSQLSFQLILAPYGLCSFDQVSESIYVGHFIDAIEIQKLDAIDVIDLAESLGLRFHGPLFPLLDSEFMRLNEYD